jgi:hypothetical protein
MRVLSAPRGLKLAAFASFLSVIFAVFESVVIARAPWWALPVFSMEKAAVVSFALTLLGAALLLRGVRSSQGIFTMAGTLWVFLSALWAVRSKNPGLGFFSIFLSVYFGLLVYWIRHEMSRSFFDPRMKWFEGLPKSIPALSCEIIAGDTRTPMKVSRLDEEGTFIFAETAATSETPAALEGRFPMTSDRKSELAFNFRDREIRCHAVPMSFFKRDSEGVGFRFFENSLDQKKELGDFIEALRGEGYV